MHGPEGPAFGESSELILLDVDEPLVDDRDFLCVVPARFSGFRERGDMLLERSERLALKDGEPGCGVAEDCDAEG